MKIHSKFILISTISLLPLTSCKEVSNAIKGANSGQTEAETTEITHTNSVVDALNMSRAFGGPEASYNRYSSWVKDMNSGPTGEERIKFGMPSISNYEKIIKHLDKGIELNAYPTLTEKAKAYKTSLAVLLPVVNEASKYYKQEDYKDDDWKGAKELHNKVIPLFNDMFAAQSELNYALSEIQDKAIQEEIKADKAEGRVVAYGVRNTLVIANSIVDLNNQQVIDQAAIQKAYGELGISYKNLESNLGKVVGSNNSLLKSYIRSAESCETEAKKLIRALKSKDDQNAINRAMKSYLNANNNLVGSYNNIVSVAEIMTK